MEQITDCQQALFTMGLQGTTLNAHAQKQNVHQRQSTTMVARQAANVRANAGNVNSISFKASNSTQMSAQQGLTMSASGVSRPSAQRADVSAFYSQVPNTRAYNTISMSAGSSNTDTSSWGKTQTLGSNFSSSSHAQKMSNMRNASSIQMSASKSNGADEVSFQINSSPISQINDFQGAEFNNLGAAPSKRSSKVRGRASKTVLMALPEGAEGDWGSVDRNYVIGGNWKSNGDWEFVNSFPKDVLNKATFDDKKVEVIVAPTDLHLSAVKKELADSHVQPMAQDVSQFGRGAYTGNITADQLTDAGIKWTLTGHSERRTLFKESDEDVALKTKVALENGLNVMLCIGELLEERESGKTGEVNARQLQAVVDQITESQWANVVVAYEPVWAIGTGKVATPEQAQDTHAEIRNWLASTVSPAVAGATRILYGGSVNGGNCADLIANPDIDGFLVGGASLKPEFDDIIKAADAHKK